MLKDLRKESNLTQKEAAERMGMNYFTYRNKERGEKRFNIEDVLKLSEIFGLSTDIIIKSILEVE